MIRENSPKYIFIDLLSVFCFAIGGAFVRYSLLPAANTAVYRVLFSLPMMLPFIWRELPRLRRRDVLTLIAAGVSLGLNLLLWNLGIMRTTQANANLLGNLTVFSIVPIARVFFKEKVSSAFWPAVAVAVVGLAILLLGKDNTGTASLPGDLAAFGSALVAGIYLMTAYGLRQRVSAFAVVFLANLGSLLFLIPMAVISEGLLLPTGWDSIWPLLMIALCSQLGGTGLAALCLGKLQANLTAVLSLTQPVAGAILGLVLFEEKMTIGELFGMAVVICGVFLAQRAASKTNNAA